jgi:hypothetical protein
VHRARLVQDWLAGRRSQSEVFYRLVYSSELNPDEGLNGSLKQAVPRIAPACSREELKRNVIGHMRKLAMPANVGGENSMAKSETSAPRGTNKVIKAFFETLDSAPENGRSQVAKAALAAIREKLTARKDKEKVTREKEKAKSARGKVVPTSRKAASSSRTANTRKAPADAAKPARSTKAPEASAPKATKRPASRRVAPKASEAAAPQPRKSAPRRPSARRKSAPEASPMDSQTAPDDASVSDD